MALRLSSVVSSTVVHRKLPLVGTFCVISLGFSSLCTSSLPSRIGCAQSLPLVPLLRCFFDIEKFKIWCGVGEQKISYYKMEASKTILPSIVVYVTVPNKEAGKKLAESIVKERLAACVNRVPGVESVYEWKGEIQTDSEELLIIKTRESLLEALTEHVKANHEYEVPEVISLPITGGNLKYLEWIKNSTRD